MKRQVEMIEGPQAWERFRIAMKAIIKVPKSAMPPNPFTKSAAKDSKAEPKPKPQRGQ